MQINKFDKGLMLGPPKDKIPEGATVSNRGMSKLSTGSFRSRPGSELLYSLTAHSLFYFTNLWFLGVGTELYRSAVSIKSGLSGNRLTFSKMAPTSAVSDYLFIAGGGELFKSDSSGNVTDWGFAAPISGPTLTTTSATFTEIRNATYRWRRSSNYTDLVATYSWVSTVGSEFKTSPAGYILSELRIDGVTATVGTIGSLAPGEYATLFVGGGITEIHIRLVDGSDPDAGNYDITGVVYRDNVEYFVELVAGGDPGISDVQVVREDNTWLSAGALGTLEKSSWGYGDADELGFDTIYVRLSDDTDPDTKFQGYVDYTSDILMTSGTYQYKITYKNSTTGHRSNSNTIESEKVLTAGQIINLFFLPDGSLVDSQIDLTEIWRTGPDGSIFFFLASQATATATYSDDGSVELSAIELPIDNIQPYNYFDDCLGPHNASMFWITRTEAGERGRVYYSPIGRAESMVGFIEITSDDAPLQKLFRYQGQLGVIGEDGIYLIGGTLPYVAREIAGAPGTVKPHTVVVTPSGVYYEALDGIRVFDGARSTLVLPGAVDRLFHGESSGDLEAFSGIVAAYARNEYIISDGSQSLAFDFSRTRFRDLGIGFSSLFYNSEDDIIAAGISATVVDFEKAGTISDNGIGIPLILEPKQLNIVDGIKTMLRAITLDVNTDGVDCVLSIKHDNSTTIIGNFSTDSREFRTIPLNITALDTFGGRITASLIYGQFELFGINYAIEPYLVIPGNNDNAFKLLSLDINTNGEVLTLSIIVDGVTTAIGTVQNTIREKLIYPIGIIGTEFSYTLTGSSLENSIDIYEIIPTIEPLIPMIGDIDDLLQYIILDINTRGNTIKLRLLHDNSDTKISTLANSSREKLTIPVGISAKHFSYILTGSTAIEIFSINFQMYKSGTIKVF